MKSVKKHSLKRIGIIIISVIAIYTAASLTATKLIYDSIFVRYDAVAQTPAELSGMVEDREAQRYASGENDLTGYLYRCTGENAQSGLVVIAPGFHAGADDYLWQIKSLLDYGWSVFAFDPTGICSSEGQSSVGFSQELLDLEATLKYIESCGRFGYNDIMLLGHSRGGYAACCALSYDYDIAAVVSVSGINSAMDGVMGSAQEKIGPVAYGNYGFLWLYQAMLFGTDTLNASADESISQSDVPVLVVHGAGDTQVPMDRYSIIAHKDRITSDRVEYEICDEPNQDGHTSLLFEQDGTANRELMERIHGFFVKSIA